MPTELRERILDEALGLMAERGSAGTSMRQLADACGVRVAALYHYFESKNALLEAVIAERNYGRRNIVPIRFDPSATAPQRLRELFNQMWRGALEEESVWRLLLGEAIRGESCALPVGREFLKTVLPGISEFVHSWVPELTDPDAAADVVLAELFLGFIRHLFEPGLDPAELGDEIGDRLVRALLG
ncbi:MAG: TetR/AcrR family transcriptional regulator [Microthrixaceae bacterium]|nr:TetR/AcrR family transcriptional regulator [Microthrixaceae bacterium]